MISAFWLIVYAYSAVAVVVGPPVPILAENDGIDDIMKGFDDSGSTPSPPPVSGDEKQTHIPSDKKTSRLSLNGYLKLSSTVCTAHESPESGTPDWRGLSKLKTEAQIDLDLLIHSSWHAFVRGRGDYDFVYAIKGRDDYPDDFLKEYEKELELREAYVTGRINDRLDIRAGRQIVVWGKSDYIRVTDVLNPLDYREFGLTDIKDLRLPLTMTRVDLYGGPFSLSGIAIHEIRFNKIPEYGSDYYPVDTRLPEEEVPGDGGSHTEFGVALNGTFRGWDMALYGARVYDDNAHFVWESYAPLQKHALLHMGGASANVALGNWLFKAEGAYIDGLEFFNVQDKTYSRTDLLAGIEYYGFRQTTLALEAANRHINGFDRVLSQPIDEARKDEFSSVFRASRNFLNETLSIELLAYMFGHRGEDGSFQRLKTTYTVTDNLEIAGGFINYCSGDLPWFRRMGDNDRIFLDLKYSF
jgi:hypothetical protein